MPTALERGVEPRWRDEGEKHWRAGDYAWMAAHVGARRVLEIGCGDGFSTQALLDAGCTVAVLEREAACRDAAALRVGADAATVQWIAGDVCQLGEVQRLAIAGFAPEIVACWMMGVPDSALDGTLPQAQGVRQAREAAHRAVAELAAALPSVVAVHLVDRTAFPWKIKDTARETLAMIHSLRTFAGLPFACRREDAVYRKLDPLTWPEGMRRGASGVVPVLGSLLARRTPATLSES